MIQDIQPHQFDNQYRPCPPDAQSYALYYEGQSALLKKRKDGIEFPRFRDLERLNEEIYEEAVYLFTIDEERFYLVQNISRERLSEFTMENKESFRYAEPQYLAFAGITGYQLNNWYRNRKFCGRCGHKMRHDEKERMMRCDHCGNMEFPKICPAVIIGLTDGDKILMSKYAGRAYKKYELLAGFTEIGETIEETVQREVMEEVGLKVKNIRYYKSQPWGFDSNLLMGFFCDLAEEGEIRLEEEELSLAEWVDYRDVPDDPEGLSLTREMMTYFRKQREQGLNP